jgi:two-component system osmolarity sensor histidine kinase EnvZ
LLPVVVLQLVVTVVFTQRHFEDVTLQMTDTVAREVQLILADRTGLAATALDVSITTVGPEIGQQGDQRVWYDFSGRVMSRHLKAQVPDVASVDFLTEKRVKVVAQRGSDWVVLEFERRRISASNPHQLFVNMAFFGIVFTIIAMIYLRNQLRPIKRLATAAEAFGRGHHIPYSPNGAIEVRAAGTAFVDMRARIERQIETRTLMLSGVSHDLRTPLTRMRLSLSMLEDGERAELEQDVDEMQGMIDAFLDFAKGERGMPSESVAVQDWIVEIVEDARRAGHDVTLFTCEGAGEVMLRKGAMRRALDNLIGNAVRYGSRAEVSMTLTEKSLRFRIEDDGPGIPEEQRADAQRPFTRLDPARNQDKGSGVGLGLAIATDIARAHGGVLRLGHSDRLGGLRADIVIAR